jgi:Restriction endonuclease
VLVLAEGDTPAAEANARGHLFEEFVGRILQQYGFEEPRTERLKVTANGIELDLAVRHRLTRQPAVVECKAYSSPVSAELLAAFYGKLTVVRFSQTDTHGFFVALPRFTAQGHEQARLIADTDKRFTYLAGPDVVDALNDLKILGESPLQDVLTSDPVVLVTEHGVFSACTELDERTRTAMRVLVWARTGIVPAPAITLVESTDYASGLPVLDVSVSAAMPEPSTALAEHEPLIVTVLGSGSDFEYQLPASPRFFVGRKPLVATLEEVLSRETGVLVLNAQSGRGKSSLALRLQQLVADKGGHALIVDSRTASSRPYTIAVLRRAALEAEDAGLLHLPENASWASLPSALRTLSNATWPTDGGPLVVFFDQFENVFKDAGLTREFRDLALGIREVPGRLVIGFAWKTDLVGWTEGHPYQLRDEIRASATVLALGPLGPREVEILLRRLEKELGQPLVRDLRQRFREYSQGLPWLFKKLAGHVLREVEQGATQEKLLAEALNVQNLFEADLAELQPAEQEALRFVARYAPVAVAEVMERISAAVVQSLLDRRLLVQVGERLDIYWDIFRDFLNTGRIPIEDSYILRQTPRSVARLLAEVVTDGGDSSVPDVARRLDTSENAVFNLARELRLMGVTVYEPNRVRLVEEVWGAPDREHAVRRRVAVALRRHRANTIFSQLAERSAGKVSLTSFARELPAAFPAVEATGNTWLSYARAFALWFEYAGLVLVSGQIISPAPEGTEGKGQLMTVRPPVRIKGSFPRKPPGPSVGMLLRLAKGQQPPQPLVASAASSLRDLVNLGAVTFRDDGKMQLARSDLVRDGTLEPAVLRELLIKVSGGAPALAILERDSNASAQVVGEAIRQAVGANWAPGTVAIVGKNFRGWARRAGIAIR